MQRALLVIMVGVLVPGLAAAPAEEASWESLSQLRVGQQIEVVDMSLKTFSGKLVAVSEEAISLRVGKDEVAIQRSQVLRVTARGKSKRLRNVLIGMGVGLGTGLLANEIAAKGQADDYRAVGFLIAVPTGVGGGAAIGAALPARKHKTVYRVNRQATGTAPSSTVSIPTGVTSESTDQAWENLSSLRVGQKIEVVDTELGSLKGQFVGLAWDQIWLRVRNDDVVVPRQEVMRVSLGEPRRLRNALIGLLAGGAAGFAAAVIRSRNLTESPGGEVALFVPAAIAIGTAVGAALPFGERTLYRGKKP